MEKSGSLFARTYSKDELLNREKLISIVNSDVSAAEIDMENVAETVDAKTRKLVAALPRRLRAKR